jgi:SAM-dependent methyltransferase
LSVKVLQEKRQVDEARQELIERGLSCLSGHGIVVAALRRLGFRVPVSVGYPIKSWDVLETVRFIEEHLPHNGSILDLGAHTSELLCVLHRLGYTNLKGIDLSPDVRRMPYAGAIEYVQGDFMRTPFEDASFDALTAISAIEHGYNGDVLFAEVRRLLKPGGYFIGSFDYWPEKIDTSRKKLYGMEWRIFSRDEVLGMIDTGARFDLSPVGEIVLDAREKVVRWGGWAYSFGWIALRKAP